MCGICGFTGATGSEEDYATLKAMCNVMAHRGPDGEGRYVADGVALGHRRLSLIDLAGGGQPMVRATGDAASAIWSEARVFDHARGTAAAIAPDWGPTSSHERGMWSIVYNGEVYNYRELREELEALGYVFITDSDTEVVLVGYISWAEAVLDRLRGMFAFAIYNAESRELFCARDFFGIKPFYYTVQGRQFIFASEIKCILEHPAYERALNENALAQFLCFQFSALHETFFKGVFKLPQGHWLRVDADGGVKLQRYWKPERCESGQLTFEQAVDATENAMRESVRFHNVADVEVGSFLSSGIDSSYLAALLSQVNSSIKTFTVGFSEYEGERDEVSWARELAGMLDVENDSEHISEEAFWDVVPLVQWHMDEPSADPSAVALYFVDKLASRRVKAVLSGEGADELFGGYRVYQAPLASAHASKLPKSFLRAGAKALRAVGSRGANYLERASEDVEDWYYTNANGVAFSPAERERLLSADVRRRLAECGVTFDVREAIGLGDSPAGKPAGEYAPRVRAAGIPTPQQLVAPVYEEVAGQPAFARMQHVDLWFWLAGDILLKTDKMAMAHSLESRVPFLDREVFRVAASIPASLNITEQQTKVVLREAAQRAVPCEWAQKQKLGFPVPLASWLREDRYFNKISEAFSSTEAAEFFDSDALMRLLEEHRSGATDNSRRIWIVYSFLVWYRVFFNEDDTLPQR